VPESEFSGAGFRARAGSLTLLYLASSIPRELLLRLLTESITGVELVDDSELPEAGDPADLQALFSDPYLLEPVDPEADRNDPDTKFKPTPAGREVPFVGAILQQWLSRHPSGPIELDEEAGELLWPLLSGWSSTVIHALAAGARTVTEVHESIQVLDFETVEHHIAMLENADLLEAQPCAEDEEEPFAITEWLRLSVAPLSTAARMELRFPPGDTAPITAADVEAAFHLTLPMLRLPEELSGSCSLAVELDEDVGDSPAGVTARVEKGLVVSCETGIAEDVDAWASASAADWLDTVIESNVTSVRSGGERLLARSLLHELHEALFGVPVG
jgi:hypothetical protein